MKKTMGSSQIGVGVPRKLEQDFLVGFLKSYSYSQLFLGTKRACSIAITSNIQAFSETTSRDFLILSQHIPSVSLSLSPFSCLSLSLIIHLPSIQLANYQEFLGRPIQSYGSFLFFEQFLRDFFNIFNIFSQFFDMQNLSKN